MVEVSPAWLNECYVQKILRNYHEDESIKVCGITVKPATAKGDNYGSDMHRVVVDFSRTRDGHLIPEKRSLIVKVAPQGDVRDEMIESTGIFVTELTMMSITLPQINKILGDVCSAALAPRSLYVQYEKPTHVVIEDLAPRGFQMVNRHAGMDLEHCLLTVRNLGKFHAASIALNEKNPEAVPRSSKGMLDKKQPPTMAQFCNSGAKCLAEETVNWPELSPRISEKLFKLTEVMFEKGCEAAICRENDFNVLNHGDVWINNLLFRYDEHRKPVDHMFVDFQYSHYGSPAVDLLYFFGTSPTTDVRFNHREKLLHEYHASLSRTMDELKCNTVVLSFDNLQESLKNRAFCEVVATMTVLPIVALEKGEELDFEDMVKLHVEYKNPCYGGKTYRKIMTELLPWFDNLGLLDM